MYPNIKNNMKNLKSVRDKAVAEQHLESLMLAVGRVQLCETKKDVVDLVAADLQLTPEQATKYTKQDLEVRYLRKRSEIF